MTPSPIEPIDEFAPTVNEATGESGRGVDQFAETLAPGGPVAPVAGAATELRGQAQLYRDLAEINRGGMGVILQATHPTTGRAVALKILHAGARAGDLARRKFFVEAQVTAQLEHPNIVPVHEVSTAEDGAPYYAMKLVRGESLADILALVRRDEDDARARWPLARLLGVFVKICDAMAFAHSKDVIHRDLKPENAMVGEFGEVLVMDWGLAKVAGSGAEQAVALDLAELGSADPLRTRDGAVMGTPAYMSPEQAAGDIGRIDARSDIYALGAILYELLTLEPPYVGDTALAVVAAAAQGALVPPRRRTPGRAIPHELEAITLRAMAADPAARYATAGDLRADVERYLDGRLVGVARYGALERTWKWLKRHALLSGVTAAALVALLAGGFGMRWYQADRDRRLAERQRAARATFETRALAWTAAQRAAVADATGTPALDRIVAACAPDRLRPRLDALARALAPRLDDDRRARWVAEVHAALPLTALRARAFLRRGALLEAAGDADRAFAARARAYRLDPTDADGLTAALGLGRHFLDRLQPEQAMRVFRTVLTHGGPALRRRALEGAAEASLALGRAADARACLAAATRAPGQTSARAALVAGLVDRLTGHAPLGKGRVLGAFDVDDRPGAEVLVDVGQHVHILRWTGRAFERVGAVLVGKALHVEADDVTGDGRPEIVTLEGKTSRAGRLRVLSLDGAERHARTGVRGVLKLRDLDGDGVRDVLIGGRSWGGHRSHALYGKGWRFEPFADSVRSVVDEATELRLGGERRLLFCAGVWRDFAVHTYRTVDGVPRRLCSQVIGSIRKMRAYHLDDSGRPLLCAVIYNLTNEAVSWILGDRLQYKLPNGLWLLRPHDDGRLEPVLRLDALVPMTTTRSQTMTRTLDAGGQPWLAFADNARATTRFVGLVDGAPATLQWRGRTPVHVADLDGDGDREVISAEAGALVVHGLRGGARDDGVLPAPLTPDRTGDRRLDQARELRSLGLHDEQRDLLEQTLADEGPRRSWIARRAALALIDLDVRQGRREAALARIARTLETLPQAAIPALWQAVGLHDDADDLDGLRAAHAGLRARADDLGTPDRQRLAVLTARLGDLDALAEQARYPGDGWRVNDALQVAQDATGARLAHAGGAKGPGLMAPVFVQGAWRLRAELEVTQLPLGAQLAVGLIPASKDGSVDARHRHRLRFEVNGGDWIQRAAIRRPLHGLIAEGVLERAPLSVVLRYDPRARQLRLRLTQSGRVLLRSHGALPTGMSRGWYWAVVRVTEAGRQLGGVVRVRRVRYESVGKPRRTPDGLATLGADEQADAAAALLLADPARLARLTAAAASSKPDPALAALFARYPALDAARRAQLQQALTGIDAPTLAMVHRAIQRRHPGAALAVLDAIRRQRPTDARVRQAQLELLLALRCATRLLAELETTDGVPAWRRDYYRSQAEILLGRFEAAGVSLDRALTRARAAELGAQRERVLALLGYQRARARWKQRILAGDRPRPSLAGYRLDEAFRPAR